ncbi:MAG: ATP-binding protein [Saprospiraceae bacterium]|nr:ATP-binding protein [Saprospiraceae bacterium]
MITRSIASDIIKDLDYFPAVGIIGPRQSGKTTLAKSLLEKIGRPTTYLDLESEADRYLLQDPEPWFLSNADQCIIIDEVQLMPRLFPLLRSVIDKKREPARFILLGSASPELVRNSSESLAGRISFHELSPFSLTELDNVLSMRQHWLRGGYPLSALAPDDETAFRWLDNYVRSFIERDLKVILRQDIEPENMRRFLLMLSHLHGEILNVSSLSNSLGIAAATVNKYLDLLEGAFWTVRLQPWYVNIGKRLVKSPKVYFRDSGMLHKLLGIATAQQQLSHPVLGAAWEGYVIEQVRLATQFKFQYYYYRTQVGAETDLYLLSPKGKTWCVEIKVSNTPAISKGFFQCVEDLQPDVKCVVVPESRPIKRADGVEILSLPDFLNSLQNA